MSNMLKIIFNRLSFYFWQNLNEAEIYCIPLVEDSQHSQYEEDKISSSSQRKRLLGCLLQPEKV